MYESKRLCVCVRVCVHAWLGVVGLTHSALEMDICACVCVCVGVCERESKRETEGGRGRAGENVCV